MKIYLIYARNRLEIVIVIDKEKNIIKDFSFYTKIRKKISRNFIMKVSKNFKTYTTETIITAESIKELLWGCGVKAKTFRIIEL